MKRSRLAMSLVTVAACWVVSLGIVKSGFAQETPKSEEQKEGILRMAAADESSRGDEVAAATFAWAKASFSQIDCRTNGTVARKLEASDQPILRWSNPEVGRVFGDVFLYTSDRRPAALVCLYSWNRPNRLWRYAEFLSLSVDPIKATVDDNVLWDTGPGKLTWRTVEPSRTPASAAPARLSQMRRLASRFDVVIDVRRDDIHAEPQSLRLLTRPLFRYESPKSGVLDGALFAFVASTDPDALLLVEARENAVGEKSWLYALARMNYDELTIKLDGTVVERFPYAREFKLVDRTRPYSIIRWTETSTSSVPAKSIVKEAR